MSDSEYESSTESEIEEPKLKYDRIRNDLTEILKQDAASCIAIHCKFVALGTHWGMIHILDHQGNNITSKQFTSHKTTVTSISMDNSGDYIASCSDDGIISVCGLYSDEHNQLISLDKPVKAVALEPNYTTSSSKQIVYGTDRLILSEKSWLRRIQRSEIHAGEGLIRVIKWRSTLIAWANDKGVKIYDTVQMRRITHIPKSGVGGSSQDPGLRPELYPAHIAWKDDRTILIGWGSEIKICTVRERPTRETREGIKYCTILHIFKTDFSCCGIAPFGDQIIALSFLDPLNANDLTNPVDCEADRPQLRILEPSSEDKEAYLEVSRDALTMTGYDSLRCKDYSLEHDGQEMFIVSPKDIIVAQTRDEDDNITWLLQTHHYIEALNAVRQYGKLLRKHNYMDVGLLCISRLIESEEYSEAASLCPEVLGNQTQFWEEIVQRFAEAQRLDEIAPYLPLGDFRLPPSNYEMVMDHFLKYDQEEFENLLKVWPGDIYNLGKLINRVMNYLDRDLHNPVLLSALAKLYAADQRYDRALAIYLRLQHPDTFALIRKHNLYSALSENILPLMMFGHDEAVNLLLDNMEYVPIEKVVKELENKENYLHKYLHALFLRDGHLGSEYHELQVRLYAHFDRSRLLPFLKSSNYIELTKALAICKERGYIDEQVFLLSRMGNASLALSLLTEHESSVTRAIEFCKDQNDADLWDELINKSIHKPEFVRGLLENIGTHVDPIILIRRIPTNMIIPGLRDALVKILEDYDMQTALWFECKKILNSDLLTLVRKQMTIQKRSTRVDEFTTCDACLRPLMQSSNVTSRVHFPAIVSFLCQHTFHDDCLPSSNRVQKCYRELYGVLGKIVPIGNTKQRVVLYPRH